MRSRRARKSVEQWSKLVDQFDSSTDTMEQFCQQQDLAMSTFQRWRSTLHRSKDLSSDKQVTSFTQVTNPTTTPSTAPSVVTLKVGTLITVTIHSAEPV